jgi:adenylate cyclase
MGESVVAIGHREHGAFWTDFSRVLLASALGQLGEVEEARRTWQELKEINPKYSFNEHFGRQPFKREEDVQRIAEGLAKAGLLT